jgi:hypothetical protein
MAFLSPKAFDFRDGDAMDTQFGERFAYVVQFEGFDYCGNQFHRSLPVVTDD